MIKLEISRLLLRPRRAQDFEAFSDFYTDEELSRYVGGLRMTSLSHLLSRPALVSPRIKRMNGFVNAVKKPPSRARIVLSFAAVYLLWATGRRNTHRSRHDRHWGDSLGRRDDREH